MVLGGWVVDGAITPQYGTKRPEEEEEVIQGGVVARSPVQNLGGARGSGLVGIDPPGSLTIRGVHRFSLLGFQPGRARVLRVSS